MGRVESVKFLAVVVLGVCLLPIWLPMFACRLAWEYAKTVFAVLDQWLA